MNAIELLQKKNELLVQFNLMAKKHAQLYGKIDISEPKSEEEKISEKQKAGVMSEINKIIIEIKQLKKRSNEKI